MNTDLVANINQSLDISLPVTASPEEFKQHLAAHINHLINHDFEKLVYYLYRIDVDENRMKKLLEAAEGENAAGLIAGQYWAQVRHYNRASGMGNYTIKVRT